MDIELFKKENEKLNIEISRCLDTKDREVITDGVMNPELYFKNNIRLAWMMKESYDSENGTGGGWSLFDMFPENKDLYEYTFKSPHKTTWQPIIYISYSVFNNFKKWSELDWISENHGMCEIVRQIAIINSQKLPSNGVTKTNFSDLEESVQNISDLLERQIILLKPNVFIFANTVNLYQKILDYSLDEFTKINNISYLFKGGNLFINTYHPAQRTISREVYVNDVISIIEKFNDQIK